MLGAIRRQLVVFARTRQRDDLARLLEHPADIRVQRSAVAHAIETLRVMPEPKPLITDSIDRWLLPRSVNALKRHGIQTLADLTVRIPRRKRWWAAVPGLGAHGAAQIESFFAAYLELTDKARALIVIPSTDKTPWEHMIVPAEVDGTHGQFRAPQSTCSLSAHNDYDAVQVWIGLQESASTQRAYRKEAERLMLWAILERGRALSSLTTEDAIAYRSFLRNPAPRSRWVGPTRARSSAEWKPFQGAFVRPISGVRAFNHQCDVPVAYRAAICSG